MTQNEPIEFEPGVIPTLKELSPRPPATLEGEQPLTKAEAANWSNTTLCAMGLPDNITEVDKLLVNRFFTERHKRVLRPIRRNFVNSNFHNETHGVHTIQYERFSSRSHD